LYQRASITAAVLIPSGIIRITFFTGFSTLTSSIPTANEGAVKVTVKMQAIR
jgi:hypothetical protein